MADVVVTQAVEDLWSAFLRCESDVYFGNRTKRQKQLAVLAKALAAAEQRGFERGRAISNMETIHAD